MTNKTIPKIDLSKYNSVERLNSNIEIILVNGLIAFDGDIAKTAKHFNINKEVLNAVYLKYFNHIKNIAEINNRNDKTEETINNIVNLYHGHVSEIKQQVDANPISKVLSEKLIKNLNAICDRVVELKAQNIKEREATINRLNENVLKMKQLELLESGQIQDNGEYIENVKTVTDKILEYQFDPAKQSIKNLPPCERKVRIIDTRDGSEIVYPSIKSVAESLGLSSSASIQTVLAKDNPIYKDVFHITYAEPDAVVTYKPKE